MKCVALSVFSVLVILFLSAQASAGLFSDTENWFGQHYFLVAGKVVGMDDFEVKSAGGNILIRGSGGSGALPVQENTPEQNKVSCYGSGDIIPCKTSKDCYEQGKNYCIFPNTLAVQQCNEGFCEVKESPCSQVQQCIGTEKGASCVRKSHLFPRKGSLAYLLSKDKSNDESVIRKKGVIVAPEKLRDAAEHISKLKGWTVLLVHSKDAMGKAVSPEIIAKETRQKILDEYAKGKFTYVLILGDETSIPIQSKVLFDNCREDTKYGSSAPVLDSYYFGDVTGDHAPDLAVGRIPFNDPSSILAYFDIKQDYSRDPLVSMVVFPDNTPVIDFNDLSELRKTLELSSYGYTLAESTITQEDDVTTIQIYKNPLWDQLNDIASASDLIYIKAHGSPEHYWNSVDDTCGSITLKDGSHPIIMADSCRTSMQLGKNAMAQGALMYLGHYTSPMGAGQFSIFDIGNDQSIGTALRDTFVLEGGDYSYILYGDPSLTFPVRTPNIKIEGNKMQFGKVEKNFILSEDGINNLDECLAKNKDNKFYMGCWDRKHNYFRIGKTSDNSILIQNSWAGSVRIPGKYTGASFDKITSVNFIANNAVRNIRIDGKSQQIILISFDEYAKRFLYNNGALENGFSIEFETEK